MSLAVYLPQLFQPRSIHELNSYVLTCERKQEIDVLAESSHESPPENDSTSEFVNTDSSMPASIPESSNHIVLPRPPETIQDKYEKYTLSTKGAIDALFWSMYLAHYGYNELHRVGINNGNEEMKEKNKIADYLHTQATTFLSAMSNYKITKVYVSDTIADLLTCGEMKWSGLVAMSLFYQCNIYVVDYDRKLYIPFIVGNALQTYVLYVNPLYQKKDRNRIKYYVDVGQQLMKVEEIHDKMVGLLHYEKPMKGVSTYKMSDLEEMAEKLDIELDDADGKMLKKTELYTKILLKTLWEPLRQ